jgi:methyl-accepting chemotaxis protein
MKIRFLCQLYSRQIEAISRMTEEASASARHNDGTAAELSGLSASLRQAVAQYKV